MKTYKTAMGKVVDMEALVAKNETTLAVGNMKVNARGDTVDESGRVIKSITEKVNEMYANTVGTRTAQVKNTGVNKPNVYPAPKKAEPPKPVAPPEELTEFEKELEDSFEDDIEVEQIKAKEKKESKGKNGK